MNLLEKSINNNENLQRIFTENCKETEKNANKEIQKRKLKK